MNPITFKQYGVSGEEITIIAERIVSFWPVDYNGNHGTCILLDNGKEVTVGNYPSEVRMAVEQTGGRNA